MPFIRKFTYKMVIICIPRAILYVILRTRHVFLRVKMHTEFIFIRKLLIFVACRDIECRVLCIKMHTKIHFIRKNAAKQMAEIRQWPPEPHQNELLGRKFTYKTHLLEVILCHLYVNLHIKWS